MAAKKQSDFSNEKFDMFHISQRYIKIKIKIKLANQLSITTITLSLLLRYKDKIGKLTFDHLIVTDNNCDNALEHEIKGLPFVENYLHVDRDDEFQRDPVGGLAAQGQNGRVYVAPEKALGDVATAHEETIQLCPGIVTDLVDPFRV